MIPILWRISGFCRPRMRRSWDACRDPRPDGQNRGAHRAQQLVCQCQRCGLECGARGERGGTWQTHRLTRLEHGEAGSHWSRVLSQCDPIDLRYLVSRQ
jgi:hypothetical protein